MNEPNFNQPEKRFWQILRTAVIKNSQFPKTFFVSMFVMCLKVRFKHLKPFFLITVLFGCFMNENETQITED